MYEEPWADRRSVLDRGCEGRGSSSSTYLLIRSALGCGRKLTGSQIMLLASGDGVGLAGFEDGVACVSVGLDLVRPMPTAHSLVGGGRVGETRSYQS